MAQIEQVACTAQKQFIMYPQIGDHSIILGDGNNLDAKFRKLYIFIKRYLQKPDGTGIQLLMCSLKIR